MPKIRLLSGDLANKIAAGEVVERPASVVKELVENSLDAGATRVRVDLDVGGLVRLRVTDDGEGMDEADAKMALERHATSKIKSADDLERILTFGFRGEALPSIASVSRLTVTTRARGASEGTEVAVEGGGAPRVKPAGCAPGTAIEVADLFFNVPARKKFLKTQATEAAHVGEVVMQAALARPDVSFTLARDGRVAREYLRVATRAERVAQAIPEDRLEPCAGSRGPVAIDAYLAPPERARAGASALHFLVNGRPVSDRSLARAVANAYGSVMEAGRYPVGVVYIELPPELVDVNVHPQKAEVRFAEGRALFDTVMKELHAKLSRAFNVPSIGSSSRGWFTPAPNAQRTGPPAPPSDLETLRSFPRADKIPTGPPPPMGGAEARTPSAGAISAAKPYSVEPSTMKSLAERQAAEAAAAAAATSESESEPAASEEEARALFAEPGFYAKLRFCAQVRLTFLICEGDDGLYVLDQHAAAERVTYDRLRRAYGTRGVSTQRLLLPDVVELSPAEVAVVEEHAQAIESLGVEARLVGASAVAVHAVPRILARARPERIVRDLVAELGRAAKRPFNDAADLVLATMACHGSIRAGDTVSPEEANALLRALDEVDFAGHCPHGRPVVTRIAFEDLERRVGR